jgi:type I restriction enzyme S subunit
MKLANIINEFISGDWGNEEFSDETPNEVYCIRGADIVPITKHDFSNIPKRYVSDKALENKTLKAGDMVVEKSGGSPTQSTGRVVYISDDLIADKENVVCSNFCTAFRVNDGWNPYFVYQYWQYIYNANVFFNFEGKTSGIKNLQLDAALSSIQIQEWQLSDQNRIADILMNLESKMHINIEINQNLEAMAKQLYDYWFVQFDFPNEDGKPYKSSGGAMVWNEELKREIPQGWSNMSIGDYAPCKSGYAFKSKDFGGKGLPVIKIGNIQENYTLDMTDSQCIDLFNKTLFLAKRYDLVIAMTGATIGKFAISQSNYWVNQRVGRFDLGDRPLSRLGFLFNSLKQEYFREQVFQIACGCAQPNISAEQIDSISILKPNDVILNQFNKLCEPLLELQSENYLQIEELTKQRDELLPLLMNGQVSVNSDLSHD